MSRSRAGILRWKTATSEAIEVSFWMPTSKMALMVLVKSANTNVKLSRVLPNNAMRYAFTLMQISLTSNGETHFLYRNNAPHSVKTCRTLMNAIADENILSVADCVSCLLRRKKEYFRARFLSSSILVSRIHSKSTYIPL